MARSNAEAAEARHPGVPNQDGCDGFGQTCRGSEGGEMKRAAALYARVSTNNGHQNPEMQLAELREYCGRRGWTVAGEYVDVGISGTKEKRAELDRLMSDAHRRR